MSSSEILLHLSRGDMTCLRFGDGPKTFAMISGMGMTGLKGLAGPVSIAYGAMTGEYTCYVFDRLDVLDSSYGVSDMSEDVAEAMLQFGLKNVDLVGFSQGGMMAQLLAIRHPELVRAVVLSSTCSHMYESDRVGMERWRDLADHLDGINLYRDFFERVYFRPNREALAAVENTATPAQCLRFRIQAQACLDFDSRSELDRLRCPAMVIGSNKDRVFCTDSVKELASSLNCDLFMYDDCGHAACDESPDYPNRLLSFFHSV